jgi:hypothetical protein
MIEEKINDFNKEMTEEGEDIEKGNEKEERRTIEDWNEITGVKERL